MTRHESSEQIRREIVETRGEMSETVDAIQARLNPESLRQEAQVTIRETLADGADSIVDYVQTHRSELQSNLWHTVKDNPVPTFLIGVGVGWLLIDALSTPSHERVDYPLQRYEDARYGVPPRRVPYGAGITYVAGYETRNEGDGWTEAPVEHAKETLRDAAESVRDTAAQVGESVRSTAEEARRQTEQSVQQARAQTEQWRRQAGEQSDEYQARVQEQSERFGRAVQQQAAQVGEQAQHYAERAQRQAQRTLNDNPLIFGAVAFGVGAAMALMLPETRQENRLMGATSDQVAETARGAAQDLQRHAKNVADEVVPEIERAAKEVMDETKAKSTEAMERVQSKAEAAVNTEAEQAKEDMKTRAKETKDAVQKSQTERSSSTQT